MKSEKARKLGFEMSKFSFFRFSYKDALCPKMSTELRTFPTKFYQRAVAIGSCPHRSCSSTYVRPHRHTHTHTSGHQDYQISNFKQTANSIPPSLPRKVSKILARSYHFHCPILFLLPNFIENPNTFKNICTNSKLLQIISMYERAFVWN